MNYQLRKEYRSFIKLSKFSGKSAKTIFEQLSQALGDQCPAFSTICRWFKVFEGPHHSVADKARGAPRSVCTDVNIELIRDSIRENPRITVRQLADEVDLSKSVVHRILIEKLKMKKICARWVPHSLTDEQKDKRVAFCQHMLNMFCDNDGNVLEDCIEGLVVEDETWVYSYTMDTRERSKEWVGRGGSRPTKPRRQQHDTKFMFAFVFCCDGVLLSKSLQPGCTFNSEFYCSEVLEPLADAGVPEEYPFYMQDNARPHTSNLTKRRFAELGYDLIVMPPYSPDLTPADFWFFPCLKSELVGQKFVTLQACATAVSKVVRSIEREAFHQSFLSLIQRCQLCLNKNGDYFEGLRPRPALALPVPEL